MAYKDTFTLYGRFVPNSHWITSSLPKEMNHICYMCVPLYFIKSRIALRPLYHKSPYMISNSSSNANIALQQHKLRKYDHIRIATATSLNNIFTLLLWLLLLLLLPHYMELRQFKETCYSFELHRIFDKDLDKETSSWHFIFIHSNRTLGRGANKKVFSPMMYTPFSSLTTWSSRATNNDIKVNHTLHTLSSRSNVESRISHLFWTIAKVLTKISAIIILFKNSNLKPQKLTACLGQRFFRRFIKFLAFSVAIK